MSASGRLCDRVPLSDITKRNGQHVNYESSLYGQKGNGSYHTDAGGSCTKLVDDRCQRDNAGCAVRSEAIVMGNPYIPGVMRLQEQGSSEPYGLSYRYNAPTAKNIGDLNGAHSWVQAHPEEHKMIQTSLELLMSQRKNVQPPIFSGSYGGDLTNATSLQVQGTGYSSKGHKMIQMPLEMLMAQSRNVCPPNLSGSSYSSHGHRMIQTQPDLLMSRSRNVGLTNSTGPAIGEEPTNFPSSQVHGTAYSSSGHKMIHTPWQMLMSRSRNVCPQNLSGSTYAMEMARFANPQVHSISHSSRGNRMVQTPIDLLMSENRHVRLPISTGFASGREPTSVQSSHVHGTVYSSSGYEMIQTPLEMLVSQSRNVCPPNLSGSTYGLEFASVANPQVHSTSYSSRGHRMIQTPKDQINSYNVALPNSTGSSVGGDPTNIPSSQVHGIGTVYSSKEHKMIQTPLELMSQSRNVCPPNFSGSSFGVELASVTNPQVRNTAYSSSGHGMIQTPMDLLMSESRNVGLPNCTVSAVSMEPTNVPSSQVHGSAYSSSGTDDDLPPPSLDMRGNVLVSGKGRAIMPVSSHARAQTYMEAQIHRLEDGSNNDDDLPPPSPNDSDMRGSGHVSGDGGAIVPASSYDREQTDMEAQIHQLEHGTDSGHDLPPPNLDSRDMRGSEHVSGNEKAIVSRLSINSHARSQTDMQAQIHQLEQQAYFLVLRAFKARSDTITWEKEDLITELREELRVSDESHRQILNKINNDDLTHSIRGWRTTGGIEESLPNNPSPDPVSKHIVSACKRQKTAKSVTASLAPPPVMHSERVATPTQPSSSAAVKALPLETKCKMTKPKVSGSSAVKPTTSSEGPSARGPLMNRYFPGGPAAEFSQAQNVNPLIGRKVMSRWPDDNSFYEVVISDYNPETGLYALVYDINTSNETWEWIDLEKMGPEDIRWLEDDSGMDIMTYLQSQGAPSSGARKSTSCDGLTTGHGRGRIFQKNVSKKNFPPPKNNVRKRCSGDIDIVHTESLIKRVEEVFSVSNPDPMEVEDAKKALEEQEHSLVDAIARLAEASADESDGHNQCHRKKTVRRN